MRAQACEKGLDGAVEDVDDMADAVLGHVEACSKDVVAFHGGDGISLVARRACRWVTETDVSMIEVVPREVLGAHKAGGS